MRPKRRAAPGAPTPPKLPSGAPQTELPDGRLSNSASYTQLILERCDLNDQEALDLLFDQVHCKRVGLSRTRLRSAQWLDVRCDVCDLTAAEWEKPHLTRVEFVGCRLMGLRLLDAEIEDALFKDCAGEYALFWSTSFKKARFEHCQLREASFQNADLSGAVFRDCDLTQADFQGAKLVGADLRGSQLEGLRIGIAELQGAIIEPSQAVHLAGLLGIVVKSADDD
jgi:uncharacterized protein YjbI with pentapeptide repeats